MLLAKATKKRYPTSRLVTTKCIALSTFITMFNQDLSLRRKTPLDVTQAVESGTDKKK